MIFDSNFEIWVGGSIIGAFGAAIVAIANIVQAKIAGRQAIELAAHATKAAIERQNADWARQDKVAAALLRTEAAATEQRAAILRQGSVTKILVNHRLTVALQAQLVALRGTLFVLSEKSDPTDQVKTRIKELQKEIGELQKELVDRAIQHAQSEASNAGYEQSA